jgi:type VI secretion system protein ImpH
VKLEQLTADPSSVDFYQAVYSLERQFSHEEKRWQGVGRDAFPADEVVRFKSVQHLGFPGQPITKIEPYLNTDSHAGLQVVGMHVSFMGLTGPSGVLPQHYTEMVLQRLKQRDKTMRDFFDLFNHRLISLFYRAWEKYRFACQYQHADTEQDSFSKVLSTLSGARQTLGLYYAGAFSQQNRSSQQLIQILTDVFKTKVELKPLQGRWLALAKDEQSSLGTRHLRHNDHACLGRSVLLGNKVWDISSAIELVINTSSDQAAPLLPGSYQHTILTALLADFLPAALKVRVTLVGQHKAFPSTQLSKRQFSLGHSGCLLVRPAVKHQITQLSYQLVQG